MSKGLTLLPVFCKSLPSLFNHCFSGLAQLFPAFLHLYLLHTLPSLCTRSLMPVILQGVTVVPEDAWSSEGSSSADDQPSAMDSLDHWPIGNTDVPEESDIPEHSSAADAHPEESFEGDSSPPPPFSAHRLESTEAMANLSNFAVNPSMWMGNEGDFTSGPADGGGRGEEGTMEQYSTHDRHLGEEEEPMFTAVANFRALLEEALKS